MGTVIYQKKTVERISYQKETVVESSGINLRDSTILRNIVSGRRREESGKKI